MLVKDIKIHFFFMHKHINILYLIFNKYNVIQITLNKLNSVVFLTVNLFAGGERK